MSAPVKTADRRKDAKKKDSAPRSTITAPAPASAPPTPPREPAPAPAPASTVPPRSFVTRLLTFVSSMIGGLWSMVLSAIDRISAFVGDWLFHGKKALYGLAVTRILFGLTAIGLLISNFSTRLYTFGSGSAWNGELAEPVSEFPRIWVFSAFHAAMGNDALYTALYLLLGVLAVLFVLGWRFRIVLPIFFCLWVGFIEANDMVGDQGDNMFRIALLLLFFADPAARWSLDARRRAKSGSGSPRTASRRCWEPCSTTWRSWLSRHRSASSTPPALSTRRAARRGKRGMRSTTRCRPPGSAPGRC